MKREQVKGHPGIRRRTWKAGGRTEIRYDAAYRGPDGRKRTRTFLKVAPAVAWLRSQLAAADHGDWFDPIRGKATLATFYKEWGAEARRIGRPRERTLLEYNGIWRKYIEPALGARRLGSITREDIRGTLRTAAAVSAWRHNDTLKVVRRILSAAVLAEHIGRNPAAGVPMMHIDQDEPWVLTPAEIEAIVDAVPGRYQALVLTAAYGSLRWSELIALTVRDLDLIRNRIRIDHTLVEAGTLIVGEPKTKRSRRWVTVPDFVTFAISEHLRLYPGKDGLVFTAERGGPIRRPAFGRLVWKKATATAELEGFQFRDLRHTGATLALQEGVSPVLVAFRLGHSTTRMIETTYGRLIESMDADIAARLSSTAHPPRRSQSTGTVGNR
jgi:integrase